MYVKNLAVEDRKRNKPKLNQTLNSNFKTLYGNQPKFH